MHSRKPSDDADKNKKPRKARAKKGETTPAKKKASAPPPPPPPPPPAPEAPEVAEIDDDANEGWVVLRALEYALAVVPKQKDNPGLHLVLLRPHYIIGTDDHALHQAFLAKPICKAPIKVTVPSARALAAVLAGEIKAAEAEPGQRVAVRWDGLVVEIKRTSADPHTVTLDRCHHGPDCDAITVPLPESFEAAATVPAKALARALDKGDYTAGLFVSTGQRMMVVDEMSGSATTARAFVAFRGQSLGIKQQPLPMATGPAAPMRPAPMGRPEVVDAEVIGELPAPSAWVQIECNRSEAWDRIPAAELADLTPYTVDEARGMVVWGPWPRGSLRLRQVWARLVRLGLEPREVPCQMELPALDASTGDAGEPRQLGAGDASPESEDDEDTSDDESEGGE